MAKFVTVDVFTETQFGGNPLAVFPDAREIDEGHLQLISREFNYSETAFVYPPENPEHTARVRIFTPTDEIPFAGHPNVGTAFVLGRQGMAFGKHVETELVFEEKAGPVRLNLLRDDDRVTGASFLAPQALSLGAHVDREMMASCLSITAHDLVLLVHEPRVVSVGLPFAVAELADLEALARAQPDAAAFAAAGQAYWHRDDRFSIFAYVRLGDGTNRLRARMFAPLSNIPEDPATGSAAAALSSYLCHLDPCPDVSTQIVIEQGVEMGRPSIINVDVEKIKGAVAHVCISGRCVPAMQGSFYLKARQFSDGSLKRRLA